MARRGHRSGALPAARGKRPAPRQPARTPGLRPKIPQPPATGEDFRARVYALIRRIPRGKVATYGQIAALAGAPRQARRVGRALGAPFMPAGIPWQRVINAQGRVSPRAPRPERGIGAPEAEQERRLRQEGVRFVKGRVDLERYRWRGR